MIFYSKIYTLMHVKRWYLTEDFEMFNLNVLIAHINWNKYSYTNWINPKKWKFTTYFNLITIKIFSFLFLS